MSHIPEGTFSFGAAHLISTNNTNPNQVKIYYTDKSSQIRPFITLSNAIFGKSNYCRIKGNSHVLESQTKARTDDVAGFKLYFLNK